MTQPSLPNEIFVIIVTYQSADHIQACLASLPEAETDRALRIVLIDNASKDRTASLLEQAVADLPARVHCSLLRNQKNLGFTCAVNQGLQQHPAGAAVLFLNPDTILPPLSLAALLKKLYGEDRIGVIAPQLRFPPALSFRRMPESSHYEDGNLPERPASALRPNEEAAPNSPNIQPSCRRFPTYWDLFCEFTGMALLFPSSPLFNSWKMGDFDHLSPQEVDQPQGAFLLARPEVIAHVGAWDERFPLFFSDVDWCRRVRQAGWKIRFDPEVFVWHAQGASIKQKKPAAIWSSHLSFWRYFRKWRRSFLDEVLSLLAGPLLLLAALVRMAWHALCALFVANVKSR